MEKKLTFNYLAIAVAVVMYQVIAIVWYGLFAEPWMAATGVTEEMAQDGGVTPYIVAIIGAAVLYTTMAYLFQKLNIESALDGAKTAALFWFGFLFLEIMAQNMFTFRPIEITFIDQGSTFLCFVLGGALLGGWRKYNAYAEETESVAHQTA